MVYEDLTTYTIAGAESGDLSLTGTTKLNCNNVERRDEAYIYKDFGAGYWGDYSVGLHLNVSAIKGNSSATSRTLACVFYVGNAIGADAGAETGSFIQLYMKENGINNNQFRFEARQRTADVTDWFTTGTHLYDLGVITDVYILCVRVGTLITFYIYSDPGFTTLIETISSGGAGSATTYRYYQPFMSEDRATDILDYVTCYIENIDLAYSPPSPIWDKYAGNPIWETADYAYSANTPNNFVVLVDPDHRPYKVGGYYWATFSSVTDGIGLAYSVDLINWVDADTIFAGVNPIITVGGALEWDNITIAPTTFMYMGGETGHAYDYWIFYRGQNAAGTETRVGIAKSNDLQTWTKYAGNPVITWVAAWATNCTGVEDFRVVKASNGNWYALYEADQAPTGGIAVGAAKTTDTLPHSGWGDEGPVISAVPDAGDFIANPSLTKLIRNGVHYYYALYEWGKGSASNAYGMMCEDSVFFTVDAWTQDTSQPAISVTAGWEGTGIVPNGMLTDANTLYNYYTGNTGANKKIGLATRSLSFITTRFSVQIVKKLQVAGILD